MDEMTIYHTNVMKADVSNDRAIITFKPHGKPPVSVQIPLVAFLQFLSQAASVATQK